MKEDIDAVELTTSYFADVKDFLAQVKSSLFVHTRQRVALLEKLPLPAIKYSFIYLVPIYLICL